MNTEIRRCYSSAAEICAEGLVTQLRQKTHVALNYGPPVRGLAFGNLLSTLLASGARLEASQLVSFVSVALADIDAALSSASRRNRRSHCRYRRYRRP